MAKRRLEETTISGRYFTKKDFRLIKEIASLFPHLSRTELAMTIGENLSWYQSNGEPKYHACIKVLETVELWGHIKLPPVKSYHKKGSLKIVRTASKDRYRRFN